MVYTGLSGNEIYCLHQIGLQPGDMVVGNSVFSMGLLGSIGSSFRGVVGGEVTQYTEIIAEGRRLAFERLSGEVKDKGGVAVTGVSSELVFQQGNIEFLSIGSTLHSKNPEIEPFSTSSDGQELYCQEDAGYQARKFVFGNVAYSIGVGQGLMGSLKSLGRGEVREYSDIFNTTRNLALYRIAVEAGQAGANCVVGIETTILPFSGVQEMLMVGTASYNPNPAITSIGQIVTSDLTCEEMWNLTNLGYVPMRLLLGTSVYSLGIAGSVTSFLKSFAKGEISELTSLIYGAREESLGKIAAEATAIGADDVVGIKTYVYQLGSGLIEFLAIGTAVKRSTGVTTRSPQLVPQAIIRDKDTFFNSAEASFGVDLNQGAK
jgi:uncharacterized protein YbjQ (UPF0145 family)